MTTRTSPTLASSQLENSLSEGADDESTSSTRPTRWGNRRKLLNLVLLVLVLAAAAVTTRLATQPSPADVRPEIAKDGTYTPGTISSAEGADAVDRAAEAVPAALSFDFRRLDEGVREATTHMTPDFAERFQNTFDETASPMAKSQRAVTRALVRGAGLVELSDDERATVLVYVDQVLVSSDSMRNRSAPAKVSQNRVLVTLEFHDGEWQVDDLTPF